MANARNRTVPERYGNPVANIELESNLDETPEEPYDDNSLDDVLFNLPTNKRRKTHNDETTSGESSDQSSHSLSLNFDGDFDKIQSASKTCDSTALSCDQNNGADHGSLMQASESSQQFTLLDMKFIQQQLITLNQNTAQILARIAIIEESLISNGTLITVKTTITEKNAFQSYNAFVDSNNLPMKSLEDVNEFENKLSDEDWNEKAVNEWIGN